MTVRQMMTTMDSAEYAAWQAYYRVDPFGEQRADLRIAQLCALVRNLLRSRNAPTVKPAAFMLFQPEKRRRRMNVSELRQACQGITEAFAAAPARRRSPGGDA